MPEADPLLVFPERLDHAGIAYMITGSIASIIYGEPRMTHDIDLVLELSTRQVATFRATFADSEFYCPPAEVIRMELNRDARGHFNVIHNESGLKADIYPIGNDPLHRWAFPLRKQVSFGNTEVWVAPPEYVILRKLQFYREGESGKHLRDIQKMLEISSDRINETLLFEKIEALGFTELWKKITRKD